LCELLRSVQKRSGLATLHITHSRSEARQLADQLLVLADGRLTERPVSDLNTLPEAEEPPRSPLAQRRATAAGGQPR
jgi:ABC-type sulfate/molybdate transport systems ATPase subunit